MQLLLFGFSINSAKILCIVQLETYPRPLATDKPFVGSLSILSSGYGVGLIWRDPRRHDIICGCFHGIIYGQATWAMQAF